MFHFIFYSVTVVFVDICHFWELVADNGAPHLVMVLDTIYQTFDELADKYLINKMETVGKTYLVFCGCACHSIFLLINLACFLILYVG